MHRVIEVILQAKLHRCNTVHATLTLAQPCWTFAAGAALLCQNGKMQTLCRAGQDEPQQAAVVETSRMDNMHVQSQSGPAKQLQSMIIARFFKKSMLIFRFFKKIEPSNLECMLVVPGVIVMPHLSLSGQASDGNH